MSALACMKTLKNDYEYYHFDQYVTCGKVMLINSTFFSFLRHAMLLGCTVALKIAFCDIVVCCLGSNDLIFKFSINAILDFLKLILDKMIKHFQITFKRS